MYSHKKACHLGYYSTGSILFQEGKIIGVLFPMISRKHGGPNQLGYIIKQSLSIHLQVDKGHRKQLLHHCAEPANQRQGWYLHKSVTVTSV